MRKFTSSELRVLWHLKQYGPVKREGSNSPLVRMATDLGMSSATLRYHLRRLEEESLVLRTHKRPSNHTFGADRGNPCLSIELIDPEMSLPPRPKPLPEFVVVAKENRELDELVAHEPTTEEMVMALVRRITELENTV